MAESASARILRALALIARASQVQDALQAVEKAADSSREAFAQARATLAAVQAAMEELGMLVRELCPECRQRYAAAAAAATDGSFEQVAELVQDMCCPICRSRFEKERAMRKREGADRQAVGRRAGTRQVELLSMSMSTGILKIEGKK